MQINAPDSIENMIWKIPPSLYKTEYIFFCVWAWIAKLEQVGRKLFCYKMLWKSSKITLLYRWMRKNSREELWNILQLFWGKIEPISKWTAKYQINCCLKSNNLFLKLFAQSFGKKTYSTHPRFSANYASFMPLFWWIAHVLELPGSMATMLVLISWTEGGSITVSSFTVLSIISLFISLCSWHIAQGCMNACTRQLSHGEFWWRKK